MKPSLFRFTPNEVIRWTRDFISKQLCPSFRRVSELSRPVKRSSRVVNDLGIHVRPYSLGIARLSWNFLKATSVAPRGQLITLDGTADPGGSSGTRHTPG